LLDGVVAERVDHLRPVEQPTLLVHRKTILDVPVAEDLGQVAPT
jgi:hypothetical protein